MVDYLRPRTLDEALALKAARPLTVLAGGTDIYPARTNRLAWGATHHGDVLDITGVSALRGITRSGDTWRFGALATWTDIIRAALPEQFDGLKAAAREVGAGQIQNRGTLAGNICTASPAGDGIPCLLSLDASVEIATATGTRVVPLEAFFNGYRRTVVGDADIVTALLVPAGTGRGRFVKLGARRYLVISIAMAAGYLEADSDGQITSARIAVGACSVTAQRLAALEAALVGSKLAEAGRFAVRADHFATLSPIDDVRASGTYRQHAARHLIEDLLAGFAAAPEGAGP